MTLLIANVTAKIFDNNILNYKLMHSINETLLYSSWTCGHCMLEVIYILVEAIVAIRDFYTISMTWVLWYIFNELRVWNVTSFVLQIHTCLECISGKRRNRFYTQNCIDCKTKTSSKNHFNENRKLIAESSLSIG